MLQKWFARKDVMRLMRKRLMILINHRNCPKSILILDKLHLTAQVTLQLYKRHKGWVDWPFGAGAVICIGSSKILQLWRSGGVFFPSLSLSLLFLFLFGKRKTFFHVGCCSCCLLCLVPAATNTPLWFGQPTLCSLLVRLPTWQGKSSTMLPCALRHRGRDHCPNPPSSTPTLALSATTVFSGGVFWSAACLAMTPAHCRHAVLLLLPSFDRHRWKQPSPSSCGDSRDPLWLIIKDILKWYTCLFIHSSPSCLGCQCVDSSYWSFVSASPQIVLCAIKMQQANLAVFSYETHAAL